MRCRHALCKAAAVGTSDSIWAPKLAAAVARHSYSTTTVTGVNGINCCCNFDAVRYSDD